MSRKINTISRQYCNYFIGVIRLHNFLITKKKYNVRKETHYIKIPLRILVIRNQTEISLIVSYLTQQTKEKNIYKHLPRPIFKNHIIKLSEKKN